MDFAAMVKEYGPLARALTPAFRLFFDSLSRRFRHPHFTLTLCRSVNLAKNCGVPIPARLNGFAAMMGRYAWAQTFPKRARAFALADAIAVLLPRAVGWLERAVGARKEVGNAPA